MAEYIVQVDNITKRYLLGKTTVDALKGVSLQIEKGSLCALVGESGSGKTTTLDLIGGLAKPTEGKIIIGGQDVTTLNDKETSYFRRKNVGFIFQTFNLIEVYTAYENVEYALQLAGTPKTERRDLVLDIMKRIGMEKFINHRPNELSGGQRQRVAIARALVKRPHIVLADEPTANLDSATGQNILSIMKELNAELGSTFIIATHSTEVIKIAKTVFRLSDGKLANTETY